MPRSVLSVSTAVSALLLLSGCGADPVELPDLVGMPLDEAHRTLEDLGFEEFEDQDAFEDRSVLMDANWVVVGSSPSAGAAVDLDDTVTFRVGQRDEQRAIEQLPADSPVAVEYAAEQRAEQERTAQEAAEDAAEQAAAEQEHVALLAGYVTELDPLLRLGNRVFAEIDTLAGGVADGEYGLHQTDVVSAGVQSTGTLVSELGLQSPPAGSRRAGTHEDLVAAAEQLTTAARTLLSAEGAERGPSLARYEQVAAEATAAWNEALTAMYAGTGIAPPLLQPA
ncbi:PASTA domain-containing protein [Modestobacter sp. URMC 112]